MNSIELLERELNREEELLQLHKNNIKMLKKRIKQLNEEMQNKESIDNLALQSKKEKFINSLNYNIINMSRGEKYFFIRQRSHDLKNAMGAENIYMLNEQKFEIGNEIFLLNELLDIFLLDMKIFLKQFNRSKVVPIDKALFITPEQYSLRFLEINNKLRNQFKDHSEKPVEGNVKIKFKSKQCKNNYLLPIASLYKIEYEDLNKAIQCGMKLNQALSYLTEKVYINQNKISLFDISNKYGIKYQDVYFHFKNQTLYYFLNIEKNENQIFNY